MTNAVEKMDGKKDKLFNFRPAFFTAVFLAFGILFGYYKIVYGVSLWWGLCLLPVLVTPLFFCEDKRGLFVRTLVILFLFFTFLVGFSLFRYQLYDYTRCGYYDGRHTVTGTVVSYVDNGESYHIVLKDINVDGKEEKGLLNAYMLTSYAREVRIADLVVLEGEVRTNTGFVKGYFRASAIHDGARFVVNDVTKYQQAGRSKNIFLLVRDKIERTVCEGMDKTSAAVTLGVLIGDTTKIEAGLLDNMRKGGIAHIFAVSGLHVGALYAFVLFLFSKTKLRKCNAFLQFVLLAIVLLPYAGVCGFSASIVRAITLCLVSYCMRRLGGAADGLNILGVAAILILLCSPCALFEIGFQLSFAACLGILLFAKRIGYVCDEGQKLYRKYFPRKYTDEERKMLKNGDTLPLSVGERFYRAFASLLSVSFAAQLFTAPLQYLAFGYFSFWSFLLNLIFVPLIGAVFAILLVCVLVAAILPLWCGQYILYVPAMCLNLALLVFEVADFSAFALTGMQLSGGSCVCYYGGVIFLTDKWQVDRRQKIFLAGACFTAFFVILALLNI